MPRVPLPSLRLGDVPGELGKTLERLFRPLNDFLVPAQAAINKSLVLGDSVQYEPREVAVPSDAKRVYAEAKLTSAQSIPSATDTIIAFDSTVEDTHSAITTGASWKFTAPRAGLYQVSVGSHVFGGAAGKITGNKLFKNGTSHRTFSEHLFSGAGYLTGGGSTTLRLAAGDYLDLRVYQDSGAAQNTSVFPHLWFTAVEIEPDTPVVATCWPLYIASKLPGPPKSVTLAQAQEKNGTGNYGPCSVDWEYVTPGGIPHVKIRNVPGLPAGKTWTLAFRLEWGG